MKKIISMATSAAILLSSVSVAVAADKEARQPDVYVNATKIVFADQSAYITDEGRTLVPARGVFEALGCSVEWDAENYVVNISDSDQQKNIVLTIDDADMKVKTGDEEVVKTLEVPAQLMIDRTMIPLRAVSEALGCMVMWDEGSYTINISEMKSISAEKFAEIMQGAFDATEDAAQTPDATYTLEKSESQEDGIVEIKLMYKAELPASLAAVGNITFDDKAFDLVGFAFDESIKDIINTNLSNFNLEKKTIAVLFNDEQVFDGCLGTLKFKVLDEVEAMEISAVPSTKTSTLRPIYSVVEDAKIIINE